MDVLYYTSNEIPKRSEDIICKFCDDQLTHEINKLIKPKKWWQKILNKVLKINTNY
jgi:hypothetical protein